MNPVKKMFPEAYKLLERRKRAFLQLRDPIFQLSETEFDDNTMEVVLTEMTDDGESLGEVFKMEGEESSLRKRFHAIMELQDDMFLEWKSIYILEN